ncbi:MAG: AhpC/TSA family protein [Prevotella sp.]|nr:AhpC/TSA family protein [Prevotella sp.]
MTIIKSLLKAGLLSYCLVAVFSACANGQKGYVINGQIEGLADGTVVSLVPMSHDNDSALAEAAVENGEFVFKGVAEEPICAMLKVKDSYGCGYLMLENTEMAVTGTVKAGEPSQGTPVYSWDVKVTGSPLTDKLAAFDARHDSLNILYEQNQVKFADTYKKYNSLKGPEKAAFQQSEEFQALAKAEKDFFDTVEKTITGMVDANKDSFWGPLLMIKYYNFLSEEQGEYYNSLPDDVKNSFYGKKMKEEIWPVGQAGEQVKAFKLTGDDGTEYDFAKLAEGKKYVMLDFWASWCGPCRKELPNVKKAYAQFKDKGFEVVSISIDKDEAAWRKAVKEEQLVWPNFRDQAVADLFKVKAVPTVYLLDSNGNIVASNMECRGQALIEKLTELLGK